MGPIGFPELVVILVIVLLIFGGKKIPELASGLGRGIKSFRDAMHEGEHGEQKPKDPKGN